MARPKKEINPEQVEQLARIGCTYEEMAAVLGCHKHTLMRRFATAVKEGKEHLKASLRRWQYQSAQNGNVSMQIWLGKQLLEQKDSALVDQSEHLHVTIVDHVEAAKKGKLFASSDRNL